MVSISIQAKPNDLFNFQGIRRRVLIAPDYANNDKRLNTVKSQDDVYEHIENEYNELDLFGDQFESYVRPSVERSQWIVDRKNQRNEIDRLGDILTFYEHKPELNELEKRVYKRLTRRDRSMQTDPEPAPTFKVQQDRIPKIRLPTPLAMERIERFLADNHWRLLDLFRTLDQNKSWTVVKEDFRNLAEKEQLNISDAQAEELITCFCRGVGVPLDYKRFARGRAFYKRVIRENTPKTPSSFDTLLESEPSSTAPSPNYLQLPPSDTSHRYPVRDLSSSHSRSTRSSSKNKRRSISMTRSTSRLSAYQ